MRKSVVCAIVAVGPDDVIGQNGIMPWYSRQDFYHFKILTTPYPCIFGKTTFANLPVRPLPHRLNVVCSSAYNDKFENDVFQASSIESAIDFCKNYDYIFICGGQKIYEYVLLHDMIDVMYLTKIYDEDLARKVRLNPGQYVKFPLNTEMFFDSNKWVSKRMIYSSNVLPKENTNISAKFFKYIRAR